MDHVVVIPAKANSSRVPRKNFRSFYAHYSLVDLALSLVSQSRAKNYPIILSTDNISYQNSLSLDLILHHRDPSLCTVEAPIVEVLRNIVLSYDLLDVKRILLLQPTSPFRNPRDLDQFIEHTLTHDYSTEPSTTFVSAYKVVDAHPARMYLKTPDGYKSAYDNSFVTSNSQDLPPCLHRNGCFYSFDVSDILAGNLYSKNLSFFEMNISSSINIDTPLDFNLAHLCYPLFVDGSLSAIR